MAVLIHPPGWLLKKAPPPGYGFRPTEVELILFYLKNKVLGKKLAIVDRVIPEVDLYKLSPWDIPERCFKDRNQQEYFFCRHQMKFASSSRKNRSSATGQWKTTGTDKNIVHKSETVGKKRILVFYARGSLQEERTGWIIHEYRLCNKQPGDSGAAMNGCVLCKLFKKSCSDQSNYNPWDVEDCAYGDDAVVPISSLTRGLGPDIPCCWKDAMEEKVSHAPNNANFTYDFPGITGQEEDCDINDNIAIAAHVSVHGRVPSECSENSFDLESTLLNCPTDDSNGCSSQQENTSPMKHLSNHPPGLTREFGSHESSKDTLNMTPVSQSCPIDTQCHSTLDFGQHQQKNEIAFFLPGFRFSPIETQLLLFYLRNKILGQYLTIVDEMMPEVDLYKVSPWDIPGKCFKGRDQQEEYFFFCRHERKFASGLRKKRSTCTGQWRTTGRDKKIGHKSKTVGMRRTLVFYVQIPLQVEKISHVTYEKTSWVIYEYSLCDQQLGASGDLQNDYVLCKLSKKNCSGPDNCKPSVVEDCEDVYSDDTAAFTPNSSFAGGLIPDIPCSKDQERESHISTKTDLTFDLTSATSQEVTSHWDFLSPHKTNGWQHSSYSVKETTTIHADIGITSNVSSFYHEIPITQSYTQCNENSFDLEKTLLNCSTDDNNDCFSWLENTVPTVSSRMVCPTNNESGSFSQKHLCSHPSELTPEFESHGHSQDTFNILPEEELCPIDPQCYCSLDVD